VGKGRSSQQGNKDRIQLGFYQEIRLMAFLWQFAKKKIITYSFILCLTEKLPVYFRDTFFSFVQCSVSLRIALQLQNI